MAGFEHLPGCWDGLVIICAGTPWDGVPFPEHHLAERLAEIRPPVLYVDPPTSAMTARRHDDYRQSMEGPRLRLIKPALARLTPVVLPGLERRPIRATTAPLVRRSMRRAVRALGADRVDAVVLASQHDLFGVCGERLRVVYATDDLIAGAALLGVDPSRVEAQVHRQARHADVAVGASQVICDRWRTLGVETALVPNGVDAAAYASVDDLPTPSDVDLPAPIAGFVGHLSERIDLRMLEAVADRGSSLLLVGPRQPTFALGRIEALLQRPNVCWVGPKPFDDLPAYLGAMDVGLTPYTDSDFNRASFPLKTLEYLAAGRPAVATDLPSIRWLDTPLVEIASSPSDFAALVGRHLAADTTAAEREERRAFARTHSWDVRASDFAEVLAGSRPSARRSR